MDPPSKQLMEALERLHLAGPREIARVRPHVRRFSRGLPTFDSVWIDALLAGGFLTPFQAKLFEEQRPDELLVGQGFVLTEQIHFEPVMPMFRAHRIGTREPVLVSQLSTIALDVTELRKLIETLKSRLRRNEISRVTEIECELNFEKKTCSFIGANVQGIALSQLMVRRGRMPEDVVCAIGSQVAARLSAVSQDFPHGDLRLSNLWLNEQGSVELLNHGLLASLLPVISIHRQLPKDAYDVIAAERASGRLPSTVASDLYSLGCIMWQLLTGRPPFVIADPVAKLNAHQTKRIPEIREFVPDVSDFVAELIGRLTQKDPRQRPDGFAEVAEVLRSRTSAEKRLRQFSLSFESAAPRQVERVRSKLPGIVVRVTAMILLAVLGGFAVTNREQLGWTAANSPESEVTQDFTDVESVESTVPVDQTRDRLDMPAPNHEGIVELTHAGPYLLRSFEHPKSVIVRGEGATRPVILVRSAETACLAPQVIFEHVELRFENTGPASAVLNVTARQLAMTGCLIRGESSDSGGPLISFSGFSSSAKLGLLVSNCIIQTPSNFIACDSPLATAKIDNIQSECKEPLLMLSDGVSPGFRVPVVLDHSSFTGGGAIVRVHETGASNPGILSIGGANTAIKTSRDQAVVEVVRGSTSGVKQQVEFDATGLIVESSAMLLGRRSGTNLQALPTEDLTVNGVLSGEFHFEPTGSTQGDLPPIQRLVIDNLAVRNSSTLPGFTFARFEASSQPL